MGLVITSKGSITQFAPIKDNSTNNVMSTSKNRTIEETDDGDIEIDEISVIDANSIKISKSDKSKDFA